MTFTQADPDAPVLYDIVDSPIGDLMITSDGHALTGLYMLGGGAAGPAPDWTRSPRALAPAAAELAEYFRGDRISFDVPLAPSGTPFQLAVWNQLTRIPFGSTASYGDVAAALGKRPVASRAVGLANGRNPISVIVPCHRVIGADGSLTGYGGGLERKHWLLRHEGALLL